MGNDLKNIDFNTTGRQPSDQEFGLVSKWIRDQKQKEAAKKVTLPIASPKKVAESI